MTSSETSNREAAGAGEWDDPYLKLASKETLAEQQAFLRSHPELLTPAARTGLGEAIRTAYRADVQQALRLAEAGLMVAQHLGDEQEYGLAMRAKANALSLTGQHAEAIELFLEATRLFTRLGVREEVGRTLSTSIRSYLLLGEYEGAFEAAAEARAIFNELGETLRIARLEINVANIYHRQNRFSEALDTYELAYAKLLPHSDIEGVAVALHNVGVCRIALDDFEGALGAYERLRVLCEEHSMPLLVAQANYNTAYLHFLRGDYTEALTSLQTTREIYRRNGDDYHLGLCDLDQAEVYVELGLSEEAVEMAEGSYQRFRELGTRYEIGRSLANLGIALGQQGRLARALTTFSEAREMFLQEDNLAWPSLLDLYRSTLLLHQGNCQAAEDLCRPTLECFRSAAMPGKQLQATILLSRILLLKGEVHTAKALCQQALSLVADLELPALSFQAWLLAGEVSEASGDLSSASAAYQACRQTLEYLRGGLHTDELKIGLMKGRVEVYERLAKLCLATQASDPQAMEKAFAYIEEARSRSLRDLIFRSPSAGKQASPLPGSAGARIEDLRRELNWYYHRIEHEQLSKDGIDPKQVDVLREQARVRERDLLRQEREVSGSGANYETTEQSRPVSLQEVRNSLAPGTVLIEYFSLGGSLSAAVVSAQAFQIVPVGSLESIQQRLRLFSFQMNKFRLGPEYQKRFERLLLLSTQSHLQALYQELIAPLSSYLDAQHLVIVPWGPLHALPFHALMDGDKYLIERFSFSYSPSASIYSLQKTLPAPTSVKSLIIGVESETTPYVRSEIDAVASAVQDAELLFGPDASESNLRAKGPGSRLIHIATHGYFRQDNPMFSAIRLADSYLSLYDLYHMELPADLLTLSGCVTGLNDITGGDELVGLVRGLFFAGARSLLLSLWDVDDQSTAELMGSFYRTLGAEPRKALALQSAMRQALNRSPHPYFWAPFKLTGTAQSL